MGLEGLSLNVIGRNLITWTKPEGTTQKSGSGPWARVLALRPLDAWETLRCSGQDYALQPMSPGRMRCRRRLGTNRESGCRPTLSFFAESTCPARPPVWSLLKCPEPPLVAFVPVREIIGIGPARIAHKGPQAHTDPANVLPY